MTKVWIDPFICSFLPHQVLQGEAVNTEANQLASSSVLRSPRNALELFGGSMLEFRVDANQSEALRPMVCLGLRGTGKLDMLETEVSQTTSE